MTRLFTTIADMIWAIPSGRAFAFGRAANLRCRLDGFATSIPIAFAAFAASWFIAALVSGAGQ
jgi:hypothetical protein